MQKFAETHQHALLHRQRQSKDEVVISPHLHVNVTIKISFSKNRKFRHRSS
jgi:hypothetical protein